MDENKETKAISSASCELKSQVYVEDTSPHDAPTCGIIMTRDQAIELATYILAVAQDKNAKGLNPKRCRTHASRSQIHGAPSQRKATTSAWAAPAWCSRMASTSMISSGPWNVPSKIGCVTQAPRFVQKAERFPGATFVVGVDTAARIVSPRYYGDDPAALRAALARMRDLDCRFLVACRVDAQGKCLRVSDVPIPPAFAMLFQEIPADQFRWDISSTQLRTQGSSV